MTNVLLVEDDPAIAEPLARALTREGYSVRPHGTGLGALDDMAEVDLVILDLGLPDIDGLDVARRIRGQGLKVPILVLTARADEVDLVVGLDAGADDYVTKPFEMNELMARVRAAIRRGTLSGGPAVSAVETSSFVIDLAAGQVRRGDEIVRLTPTEYHVLEVLARNLGRLVSGKQLLADVWGPGYEKEQHYLRVYMAQLRRKLEPDPAHPRHLVTEPGLGYRLEA